MDKKVIRKIFSSMGTINEIDVSTISGATMSSRGIIEAVADALKIEYKNENNYRKNFDKKVGCRGEQRRNRGNMSESV